MKKYAWGVGKEKKNMVEGEAKNTTSVGCSSITNGTTGCHTESYWSNFL